jgi:hypothetical protein
MVKNGALRLFRVGGVDVYIHWSWVIIVYFLSSRMGGVYSSPGWIAADIAGYILMVGIHETVQLIAGRAVGGNVTEMTISFLGRNSNMELPLRPWPVIITYTAGILAYAMVLGGTGLFFYQAGYHGAGGHDLRFLSIYLFVFNIMLFVWAAAPVYPLDGGKVLHGLLWLFMSRKRSLQVACLIGIPISLAMIAVSLYMWSTSGLFLWTLWTVMIFLQCLAGFRQAKVFDMLEKIPRRTDVACPHCKQHPFVATTIQCSCGQPLDPFETRGLCPSCGSSTTLMPCPLCRQRSPIHKWFGEGAGFEVQDVIAPPVPAPQPPNP